MIILSKDKARWLDDMWAKLENKLASSAILFRNSIPYKTTNGVYRNMHEDYVQGWTNGFFGGVMWLMYNATKNDEFRLTAENQEKMLDDAIVNYDVLHHDVGFMWGLTAKANYILTGNKDSRNRSLFMANVLSARANIKGGYIRPWNGPGWSGKDRKNQTIIDTMMNLPLLYWASEELEDDRFKYVANMHADMALFDHMREDGSIKHLVLHNEVTPGAIGNLAGQGYSAESTWSRGQSWAVYGFALCYLHTGDEKYLEASKKAADFFLKEVEKSDYKTLTDFAAPPEPLYYDNSAGACASCGMIELYKVTKDEKYLDGAIKILQAMEEDCIFDDSNQSILQNCMESYSKGESTDLIYGDFFLCEALLKLRNVEFLIW